MENHCRKANACVRKALKDNSVYQWELADCMQISEYTLTRMLRHELPVEKQKEMFTYIEVIAGRKNNE